LAKNEIFTLTLKNPFINPEYSQRKKHRKRCFLSSNRQSATPNRTTYIQTAQRLGISESTADKQIARCISGGVLTRQKHGEYYKTQTSTDTKASV
jgi:predicted HTH transcriptional regulator